jgi:hypothetical protein
MVKQYKAAMEEATFSDKLVALTDEIEHLRSLLPADIDNEFLKEVENKLQKSKGNNIDWRGLQKSELFEAVMANQSIKKESSIIANVDKGANEELSAPSKLKQNKKLETAVSDIIIAEEITEQLDLKKASSTKQTSQVSRTKQKSEQVEVAIGAKHVVEAPEVYVENVVITNVNKSSSEEVSGFKRLEEPDQGLKHTEQLSIEENKAEAGQETKVVVGAEKLKKTEDNLSVTPANNNKPNKKQDTAKEARLDFEEVKRAINPVLVESIFRQYGQVLNPDGKMEKKGNQLFCGSLNINLRDGRWYRFSDGSTRRL